MKKGPLIALIVVVLVVLGLAIMAGFVYLSLTAEPSIPAQTYLQIDLHGVIKDSGGGFSPVFADFLTIRDLWYQIERAAADRRIKGLVLKIGQVDAGYAKVREIGLLMQKFRSRHKPVVAFIEAGGLKEYYLASFADRIHLFKGGMLNLCGPAAEALFLKNTLSKLGIEADMFHVGDYKTATNIYTEERMTPAHRESLGRLLNDIYGSMVREIAVNRKMDEDALRALLDESPLPKQTYLEKKLVDRIGYFDEIFDSLPRKYTLTSFNLYAKTSSTPFSGGDKIAVIFASGEIYPGRSGSQSITGAEVMGADTIAEYLRSARKSSAVKAVVLRIDSPGGSAIASDVILREAELLARNKPLVISMSDVAASGGYWVSLAGAKIYAQPQTITGSIGVISGKFVLKGLYDKIGVTKEQIKTTKYSGMYSDYTPFSPQEREKILADIQEFYREFLRKVAKGRGLEVASVEKIAQGRVWSGESARELKLIDSFGGLSDAVAEAKKLARIPPGQSVGLRLFPKKRTLLDMLFQLTGAKEQNPIMDIQAKLKLADSYFPALALPFQIKLR